MTGGLLVTGADGQVGRELQLRLGAGDACLARSGLDITDPAAIDAVLAATRPRAVINAAAYTYPDRAESEAHAAMAINRDGAANLALACEKAGIPLLHISTDYVFDGSGVRAWREDDATGPINIYGRSKLEGEQRVQALCSRHVILRTAWVFSAHGSNFVRTMLRLGRERSDLSVVSDQTGGPTAAADIAACLLRIEAAVQASENAWGVYHYAGAPATSWFDFAAAIFDAAGLDEPPQLHPIASSEYPTAAARPMNSILDCSKIAARFGIEQPDWKASLQPVVTALMK
ncbi:MAG: dTDP-4-dehydrorhamnose reductase [Alphaproteobacteria bacterium]|nr:dTDP-4-dehydrorhamnose reductase [Alphaproteobacteria bacterium]MBU2270021.1 dTDP-4-dehydrorhamnose reductase [Alphaproteobacteria bacterium]MBU2417864.1 dTDP-4-dehydrorhamnose reductase [Alphaproteobacteria bacterium]